MKILTFAFVFASLLVTSAAQQPAAPQAQAAPRTPLTSSEPHERMAFFAGTWTADVFPPEANMRETCDWLGSGRRHIVCRSTWQVATGQREGLSIFSYRASDAKYIYQGFRPSGATQTLIGTTADGKSWEFLGDEGTGPARLRTRVRILVNPEGNFRFTEQTATGDAVWTQEEVVNYRKVG